MRCGTSASDMMKHIVSQTLVSCAPDRRDAAILQAADQHVQVLFHMLVGVPLLLGDGPRGSEGFRDLPLVRTAATSPPPPSLQCGPMFSGKLVRCVIDLTGKVNFYTGGFYCFVYTSLLVSAFLCCALRLFCVFRFASSSYSSFQGPVSSSSRVLHIYNFIWCVKWGQMHERNFDVMCTADPHSFYTHMPLLRRATRRRVENSLYPPPIIDSSRFSIPFFKCRNTHHSTKVGFQ